MWDVDIFIPFWGNPRYLETAVASVLAQSSPHWRLTVIDDCYPQDVSYIFSAIDDPRVCYMRNDKNLGIIENFKRCQALAESDYTVFMGCDDVLLPGYVEAILASASRYPYADVIQPGVVVIDQHGESSRPLADRVKAYLAPSMKRGPVVMEGQRLAASLMHGDWLYWPSLAFRTEALAQVRFLEDYEIILDVGLLLDMVVEGARLLVIPDRVFEYRRHQESLSSTSLVAGQRLSDERKFFTMQAQRFKAMGWHRAARAARWHLTSRLYAATLLPGAMLKRDRSATGGLMRHVVA